MQDTTRVSSSQVQSVGQKPDWAVVMRQTVVRRRMLHFNPMVGFCKHKKTEQIRLFEY